MRNYFPIEAEKSLLCMKGVFPYNYVNDYAKLLETKIPSRDNFYDSLNNCEISDDDYNRAKLIWTQFKRKSLGENFDLYLKTDVLLLADVFENFRKTCQKTYGLDPAQYYTAPGLTWDALLKFTKVELELLTDIDMLHFIKNSIRGGISQCSHRHAIANDPYMGSKYNPEKPISYVIYWDFNNLYGWAMAQVLPKNNFRWLEMHEIHDLNIMELDPNNETGYIFEVDLEYPSHLHDLHDKLPFCPENKETPNCKTKKLILDLNAKTKYAIHLMNLQQCLKHGLILKNVYRVLSFSQSKWMKPYIDH